MTNANKDYQLILIDGSSYIYRAFYALPPMKSAKGKPTSVVFGVVNMVRKLINQYPNSHLAVVFDAPGKNFRHQLYDQYKATRPKMPDEIREQITPLHNIIKAMGINLLMIEGVEADDVLGTLANHYAKTTNQNILISSGDKDLAQLVNDQISVVDTMKNITFNYDQVLKKFGVKPNQIVDYLALVGDSSDNIPGVPKVGAKTAQRWLAEYHSVDEIIKRKDQFKGKVGELLRENIDQLKLSYQLATIDSEIPLEKLGDFLAQNQTLKKNSRSEDDLIDLYREMSFNSWIVEDKQGTITSLDQHVSNQELSEPDQTLPENKKVAKVIKNEDKFKEFIAKSRENANNWFIFWLTNQHNKELKIEKYPNQIEPIAVLIDDETNRVLIRFDKENLSIKKVVALLKIPLEDERLVKISVQAKFDLHLLSQHQINAKNLVDVSVLAWMLDSSGRHDLKNLSQKYLQQLMAEIWYEDSKIFDYDPLSNERLFQILSEQSKVALALYQLFQEKLNHRDATFNQLVLLENKALFSLARMEQNGVLLDEKILLNQGTSLKQQVKALEKQAHQYAGEAFNLASSKQVAEILYDKLKLPIVSKTPAGKPSTAESALEKNREHHPIAEVILNHRLMMKLITTYIDSLPAKINPKTKRIHTTYNQTGTITGRLSSTEPNLQNIPIRSIEGKKIRKAFVAAKNSFLVCADYSQIELRLMADFSQDQAFINAFNQGLDIHSVTASEVFNQPIEKVDSDLRRKAKAVNFGLIYGISAFGLSRQLKVPANEAKGYIDAYFSRYQKVLQFMENQKLQAKKQGFVESVMGRRIYLPDIYSRNFIQRSHAERMAINAPLQASASDIIKKAMVEIDRWLRSDQFNQSNQKDHPIKMILQIHDELVFEVHQDYVDLAMEKIKEMMQQTYELKVPLIVNLSKAKNLGSVE